jgi:hypothetical protein
VVFLLVLVLLTILLEDLLQLWGVLKHLVNLELFLPLILHYFLKNKVVEIVLHVV